MQVAGLDVAELLTSLRTSESGLGAAEALHRLTEFGPNRIEEAAGPPVWLRFLRDLCTLGELHDMAQRWAVVRMLDAGLHYADISKRTGASTATITRIASWLHHGEGGYRAMLERFKGGGGDITYPLGDER